MKILLLEDDQFIADEIKLYFETKGIIVDVYENGEELLKNDDFSIYDILLFDINMPKMNGFEALKALRDVSINTPAVFITSMSDLDYVKQAYKEGASDYIRKPFYFEELELRINRLIYKDKRTIIKLNDIYSFDLTSNELLENGINLDLTENEKNLLYKLVKNIGYIVSTSNLIEYVWGSKEVSANTLRTQIKKIRNKLKNDFIINIRGTGYKIEQYD